MKYEWKDKARFNITAQVFGEELERLRLTNQGFCSAQDLLENARNPNSPLHALFRWNDKTAAEAYRLTQARRAMRTLVVRVTVLGVSNPQPVMVNVVIGDRQTYTTIAIALADEDMRTYVLGQVMRELQRLRLKHRDLKELTTVFAEIDRLEDIVA